MAQNNTQEFIDLANQIADKVANLGGKSISLPGTDVIKKNLIMRACGVTAQEAEDYIKNTVTSAWDNAIEMAKSEIKAMFPELAAIKDIITGIITSFTISTTAKAAQTAAAAVQPVATPMGPGTANISAYNQSVQQQQDEANKTASKNIKTALMNVGKTLAQLLAKMAELALDELIGVIKPIAEMVNTALGLYNSIPIK